MNRKVSCRGLKKKKEGAGNGEPVALTPVEACVVCVYTGDHDTPSVGVMVCLGLMETGASKPLEIKTACSIFLF